MVARAKNPIEWVTDVLSDVETVSAAGTELNTNGRIQLLLDRDEVADIEKVKVIMKPDVDFVTDFANDESWEFGFAVSTNPRVLETFIFEANVKNLEDRNIFFFGFHKTSHEMIATIANQQQSLAQGAEKEFEIDFSSPLTVGGDIGWCAGGKHVANANNAEMLITVYFRRRKSNKEKANLIILRR